MRGNSVPPATGETTCCGNRHPSCSAISNAHVLRTFGVVGAQIDVRESPAVAVRDLRAQPVDVVIVAMHGHDTGSVHAGAGDLGGLEIIGDEHEAREPEARRMRGHAASQVAGRRTGQHAKPEFDGTGRGDRDDAILVRTGRVIDGVVLDVAAHARRAAPPADRLERAA